MADESEKDESNERKRKWMKSLAVVSSDDEDSVAGNMIESPETCSFDKGQMIALRFPYPMFSDESEEELPNSFSSVKRKLSFIEEGIESSTENQSYKHKKRKMKQNAIEKSIKGSHNCVKKLPSQNLEETSKITHKSLRERKKANNNKHKSSSLSNRSSARSKSVTKLESSENYTSSDDNVFQDKSVVIRINPRRGKQICKYIDSSESSDDEHVRVKATNDKLNLPTPATPTSRFLDSSSDGDNSMCSYKQNKLKTTSRSRQNFRRLHFLSTSSSGSDVEDSDHKVNECKLKNNISSVKQCHSISASSDEKENDSEVSCVPVKNKMDSAKISFSDSSNNSSEPCQINKIINSAQLENRAKKRYLPNKRLEINTDRPNFNSNVWKNIANVQLKAQAKSSSHQSLVQSLKKKLLSSNMSSIEVHKKMHSRAITLNKEVKTKLDSKKHLKSSLKSHGTVEDLLKDNLDNVTVTSSSEVNCTKANTSVQNSELGYTPHTDSKINHPRENLNVNIESSQSALVIDEGSESTNESKQPNSNTIAPQEEYEDIDVNLSGFNKKVRYSHFNKLASNKQDSPPLQKDSGLIRKKLHVNFIKTQSNNTNTDEICATNDSTQTSAIECDVLGTILSQMENNPYKVQKVPVKKPADPIGQLLGWKESPALTGHLQNQSAPINLQNNIPVVYQHETNTININKIQNSILPSYSPLNNKNEPKNVKTNNHNEIRQYNYVNNSTVKSVDNSKPCKERLEKTNSEVVFPFYLAPNEEYDASKSHQDVKGSNNKVTANRFSVSQSSYAKTAVVKNNIKRTKIKHKKDNNINMKSKEPVVNIHNRHSGKIETNHEENVNHKLSRKNSIQSKEDNKKTVKRKTSSAKTSDVDVRDGVKEPIKLGLFNCAGNGGMLRNIVPKKLDYVCIKPSGKIESNCEENINPKLDRMNSIQSKEHNKKSAKRKNSNGGKSGVDVLDCVKEPIEISPFNRTGNVEVVTDVAAKTTSEENEISQKGIRVRLGGNVFRLTCGPNMIDENNTKKTVAVPGNIVTNKPTIKSHLKRRDSIVNDVNDPKKCQSVKHTDCSKKQTTDHPSSDKGEDTSSSSDETSSSSSSKSDSTDEFNITGANPTTNMSKLGDETNITFDSIILEEDDLGKKKNSASVIPDITKKAVIIDEEASKNPKSLQENTSSDCVIISSESSDSENSNCTINKGLDSEVKADTCNTTAQIEKNNNSNEMSQSSLNECKVGTIRIKTLKELGNYNPLPKNAFPCTVFAAESSSVPVDLNVPKILPIQDSMLNKLLDRVHNPEITPLQSKTTVSSQGILCSNLDKLFQVLPKSSSESHENQQKAVAVIKPVCTDIKSTSNSDNNLSKSLEKGITVSESVIQQTSSQVAVPNLANPSVSTVENSNTEKFGDVQRENELGVKYVQVPLAKKETETLFFKLCDNLFTELVYFKIPKLVDDLHLSIVYDIMKEERLKKIEQLISPETIIIEKRRAEKDFADMIKVRSQSFVPLFLTIVDKINKVDFKSLVIAVYCRIIQQLERVDPINRTYRFKLRHLIKSMIEKFSNGGHANLCVIFGQNDLNFVSSYVFIEDLLLKYDKFVEQRQLASNQSELMSKNGDNNTSTKNNTNSQPPTDIPDTASAISNASTRSSVEESEAAPTELRTPQNPSLSTPKPPPPPIGNLDQMLLFKLTPSAKHSVSEH